VSKSASRHGAGRRGKAGRQRGNFAVGLVVGLLVGLALALGVALYIAKVPVPFMDKVPQRSPEQDQAEAERNKNWNPNAPLAPAIVTAPPASGPPPGIAPAPAVPGGRDPAAILSGGDVPPAPAVSTEPGVEPFTYFVQVGAYTRSADAESQRAAMAMQGLAARVFERQQAGRVVYRVRLGPFERQAEADAVQAQLRDLGVEGQLVRVQRP
jgi:cell division protein FtsN